MYSSKIDVSQFIGFSGHKASIFSLEKKDDEGGFFSGDGDGYVVEWDLNNPENGKAFAQLPSNVFAIKYIADYNLVAVGTMSGVLYFLDYKSKKLTKAVELHKGGIFDIWRSDDSLYVCGGDGKLSIWNLKEMKIRSTLEITDKSLRSIDFNLEKNLLAIGSSDHKIHLLDFPSLEVRTKLKGHTNSVFSVKFSADGEKFFSGSRDAQLKVWNMNSYHEHRSLAAHLLTINSIVEISELGLIATASRDKSFKFWDTETEKLIKVIHNDKQPSHTHSVNKLLWLGYENMLISAGDDRQLLAWKVSTE